MSLITLFDNVLNNDVAAVTDYLAVHVGGKRVINLSIVYAAALGNAVMVKVMLDHGIPSNTFDVLNNFQRDWEPRKLKRLQYLIDNDMKRFTRGWAPILTPACVAAFYGHKNVIKVLYKHDLGCMTFDPYSAAMSTFIGGGNPPEWNAATCALFGNRWDIASALVDMGVVPTDMEEQYPLFLEFRTTVKIPKDAIDIVFSFLG